MARWFVDRNPDRGIPFVSLRSILPEARFVGCSDFVASGCSSDSVRIEPGQVFVAGRGAGPREVARALDRGAAAVVVERPIPEAGHPQVIVPDAGRALGRICQALAGGPSSRLDVVAIAGASGRSACGHFLRSILAAAGLRYGRIDPEGWSDGRSIYPPSPSPPSAEVVARMLGAMVDRRADGGLIVAADACWGSDRYEAVSIDAALVVDARPGPSSTPSEAARRRRDRARAVRRVRPGGVVVVEAGEAEADLLGSINPDARPATFGVDPRSRADVVVEMARTGRSGHRIVIHGFHRSATIHLRPLGSRRLAQAAAAATLAWSRGIDLDDVAAGLESVDHLPGRLEPVEPGAPIDVRVDRARTVAELRGALGDLRESTAGRVHCVVGLDGSTAPGLAGVAESVADRIVVTLSHAGISDADARVDSALATCHRPGRVLVEPGRASAVAEAIRLAEPGDAVLLACGPILPDGRPGPAAGLSDLAICRAALAARPPLRRSA